MTFEIGDMFLAVQGVYFQNAALPTFPIGDCDIHHLAPDATFIESFNLGDDMQVLDLVWMDGVLYGIVWSYTSDINVEPNPDPELPPLVTGADLFTYSWFKLTDDGSPTFVPLFTTSRDGATSTYTASFNPLGIPDDSAIREVTARPDGTLIVKALPDLLFAFDTDGVALGPSWTMIPALFDIQFREDGDRIWGWYPSPNHLAVGSFNLVTSEPGPAAEVFDDDFEAHGMSFDSTCNLVILSKKTASIE